MAKDLKYIRKRKRKYGTSFLIEIPYKDETGTSKRFTDTVRVIDYGDEKTALIAAQRIRNNALHDIQTGKLRTSFPTVKYLYHAKWELMPLSMKSRKKYDVIYRSVFAQFGDVQISKITLADIQRTLNDRAETHTDDGVRRVATLWKQLYKTALMLGYDVTDLTDAVIMPKSKIAKKSKDVTLTVDQFKIVLDAVRSYDGGKHNSQAIYYMLLIMYYTGCRPAEALALQRSDIHPDYISINKSVGSTATKSRQLIPTKTKSSIRHVPIVPELRTVLGELFDWSTGEQLLTDEQGNLFEIDYVSNFIRLASKRTGIHFNAYMLRHMMSSDLLHAGDSAVARDLLGHSSFGMTLDYARSTDKQLHDAIRNRTLAESQPKNKNHQQPSATIIHQYQILRFAACLRIISIIKELS